MTLTQAAKAFLDYQKAKGNSPRTVRTYHSRLDVFLKVFRGRPLGSITPADVDAWLLDLADRDERYTDHPKRETQEGGLSPVTINGYKQTVKTFFRFCLTRDYVDSSPAAHVNKKRVKRKSMVREKMMRRADFPKVLQEAHRRAHGGDPLPLALFTLIAESAARAGEVASMHLSGLDLDEREALVDGKAGERTIVFGDAAAAALEQWLKHRQYVLRMSGRDDPGSVFMNTWPPPFIGEPITSNTVTSVIRGLGKAAGVDGPCSPHAIRHLVASHLAQTQPLALVQELLGHQDIATTMIYVWPDNGRVKDMIDSHGLLSGGGD